MEGIVVLDLTISIINTNNRALALGCLHSLYEHTHRCSFETYVVDNACTDGSAEAIAAEFPQIQLILNESKLGFSTNNNLVFRQAQGRYLLMLNDDTVVQPGALDNMVGFMDAHLEVGVVGAKLLNPDGTNQPAFASFPGLSDFWQPLWASLWPSKWDVAVPREVDSVCGACMMVRREVAETVGLLDTDFDPLYVEEREWCYRIRQQGSGVYHLPSARVVHFGGQTAKHTPDAMTGRVYAHRLLFCKKHYGWPKTVGYRMLLSFVSLFKAMVWGFKALLEPKKKGTRALRRVRCHLAIAKDAWS
jgi:GT2 family glycosyltransferase